MRLSILFTLKKNNFGRRIIYNREKKIQHLIIKKYRIFLRHFSLNKYFGYK